MKFEDFMYWLPLILIILGWNISLIIRKLYLIILYEILLGLAFSVLILWCKYWLDRKYEKEKNQGKNYY